MASVASRPVTRTASVALWASDYVCDLCHSCSATLRKRQADYTVIINICRRIRCNRLSASLVEEFTLSKVVTDIKTWHFFRASEFFFRKK